MEHHNANHNAWRIEKVHFSNIILNRQLKYLGISDSCEYFKMLKECFVLHKCRSIGWILRNEDLDLIYAIDWMILYFSLFYFLLLFFKVIFQPQNIGSNNLVLSHWYLIHETNISSFHNVFPSNTLGIYFPKYF